MGQKVNPKSLRIGIINTWDSRWFAGRKDYAKRFHADLALRRVINEKLKNAGVTKIEIERSAKKVVVNIHAAKPGLIIGRQGVAIEDLRDMLSRKFNENIEVNILEIPDPDLSAQLIGELVAVQIERRIAYRRAVKMALQKAIEAGAKGVKIHVAGRLNGVEIARREYYKDGNIPLHTLRADVDYAQVNANTTYGVIGIKVWVYKGMVFKKKKTGESIKVKAKEEK
ncbi:30S ribosomal protein S3 [Patescibacteria group bacterium]|nr:30S ribosomal protein S3 [Patescibacteria group bacterium]MBU1682897.1 30S ribosomal protein S3 [Patescibacteria group bacterium]MBU1934637.1 30S ribosomal protein S3 [Patescibacteria group bacterium]